MEISDGSRPVDAGRTPFEHLHVNIPTTAHGDSMDDEFCIQTCPSRLQCSSAVRRLEDALRGSSYPLKLSGSPPLTFRLQKSSPSKRHQFDPFVREESDAQTPVVM